MLTHSSHTNTHLHTLPLRQTLTKHSHTHTHSNTHFPLLSLFHINTHAHTHSLSQTHTSYTLSLSLSFTFSQSFSLSCSLTDERSIKNLSQQHLSFHFMRWNSNFHVSATLRQKHYLSTCFFYHELTQYIITRIILSFWMTTRVSFFCSIHAYKASFGPSCMAKHIFKENE